jgi:hypothetical protein
MANSLRFVSRKYVRIMRIVWDLRRCERKATQAIYDDISSGTIFDRVNKNRRATAQLIRFNKLLAKELEDVI